LSLKRCDLILILSYLVNFAVVVVLVVVVVMVVVKRVVVVVLPLSFSAHKLNFIPGGLMPVALTIRQSCSVNSTFFCNRT